MKKAVALIFIMFLAYICNAEKKHFKMANDTAAKKEDNFKCGKDTLYINTIGIDSNTTQLIIELKNYFKNQNKPEPLSTIRSTTTTNIIGWTSGILAILTSFGTLINWKLKRNRKRKNVENKVGSLDSNNKPADSSENNIMDYLKIPSTIVLFLIFISIISIFIHFLYLAIAIVATLLLFFYVLLKYIQYFDEKKPKKTRKNSNAEPEITAKKE